MAVTKALGTVDGIQDVKVSLEAGEAVFEETRPVDMAAVKEKIKKAGFEVG
jgi:copper chaperone CopZ